jgi:phenylacetate-CoA ligase
MGYGSMLHLMATEAIAGRLKISPLIAANAGEPLLAETRTFVRNAFGIDIRNTYASIEAYFAESWSGSELLHLVDDTVVIELVDADNQPVSPGTQSTKLLITNLANRLQPLIRYEITDEVTEATIDPTSQDTSLHPPGPWTGRWIHPPLGRNDDWFTYGTTVVHPNIFRSQLAAVPAIAEYQVTQTTQGAHLAVVTTDHIDAERLGAVIAAEVQRVGVDNPTIQIEPVDAIERHADSGKLRRFVRLS